MNQEYLQLTKNYFVISDENGHINFVSISATSGLDIKNIIQAENNLEELKNNLNKYETRISQLTNFLSLEVQKKIFQDIAIVFFVLLGFRLTTLLDAIMGYVLFTLISVGCVLSVLIDIKNYSDSKKELLLKQEEVKEIKSKISKLKKRLEEVKEINEYKRNDEDLTVNKLYINNNDDIVQNHDEKIVYKRRVLIKK